MPAFSIREAIRYGWTTFKAHKKFLIGLTTLVIIFQTVPAYFFNSIENPPLWASIVGSILLFLLQALVSIGTLVIYLAVNAGTETGFRELFVHWKKIIPYVLGSIAYGVAVLVGLLFLIVPGIIMSIRLQFWLYALVEKGIGPIAALKESWRITKGSTIRIMLFNLTTFLVTLLGILSLGVGLLVSSPVVVLAMVRVYRTLSQPLKDTT